MATNDIAVQGLALLNQHTGEVSLSIWGVEVFRATGEIAAGLVLGMALCRLGAVVRTVGVA